MRPTSEHHLGTETAERPVERRRAIALGLTGAVAGLASVVGADRASAASGDALIIGAANDAGAGSTTLTSTTTQAVLHLTQVGVSDNPSEAQLAANGYGVVASGQTAGVQGGSGTGPGVHGGSSTGPGVSGSGATGVLGNAISGTGAGVDGYGYMGVQGTGTYCGVRGASDYAGGIFAATKAGQGFGLIAGGDIAMQAQGQGIGLWAIGGTAVLAQGATGTGVSASGAHPIVADASGPGAAEAIFATGPIGVHATGAQTGVIGDGGIGGTFSGTVANMLLKPNQSDEPPYVDHGLGEVFVTTTAGILVCVVAGNPGTWVRLGFNPTAPTRVCDTRAGSGQAFAGQPIGPGQELVLPLVGVAPLPSAGVSAVVMNVTMATCTADGWLTVYPNGQSRPTSSNLNFAANQSPKANLVVCGVGVGPGSASPAVRIYNAAGTTNVVVDVNGFYS